MSDPRATGVSLAAGSAQGNPGPRGRGCVSMKPRPIVVIIDGSPRPRDIRGRRSQFSLDADADLQ